MKFVISTATGFSPYGYKDSYMLAIDNAYCEIEEGLEEWLEENMKNRYTIIDDIITDDDIQCVLNLAFIDEEDAMAYKLRWL